MKLNDELEQLLKNLHLKRMLEIYPEQVGAAEKEDVTYSEFLTRLLRAQWHHRQETALAWRIRQARLPEPWSLSTFPFARQPGVHRKQIHTFAELEFKDALKELQAEKDLDKETMAYSTLAQSLLVQGKQSDAEQAITQADELLLKGQNRAVRFFVAVTEAEVLAALGNLTEARRKTMPMIDSAKKYGFAEYELEGLLVLAQVEIRSHHISVGRSQLENVERDARKKDFGLIVGKITATRSQQRSPFLQQ
jgi:tetratricopeptide (TPR) repeat protein